MLFTFSIASLMAFASTAIARPNGAITPLSNLQLNRLSRDLTPSAADEFFRQRRLKLERELRLLAEQRKLTDKGLLKVAPDAQRLPDTLPTTEPNFTPQPSQP
ncbi:MAG: hypothetical protein IGS48_09600 [Oscillatoriales cyanobacterium C42_A2020_001]|nr:hypothetical protein [Leptolyngbyaceae cyanobacterium C42_A2020_001]